MLKMCSSLSFASDFSSCGRIVSSGRLFMIAGLQYEMLERDSQCSATEVEGDIEMDMAERSAASDAADRRLCWMKRTSRIPSGHDPRGEAEQRTPRGDEEPPSTPGILNGGFREREEVTSDEELLGESFEESLGPFLGQKSTNRNSPFGSVGEEAASALRPTFPAVKAPNSESLGPFSGDRIVASEEALLSEGEICRKSSQNGHSTKKGRRGAKFDSFSVHAAAKRNCEAVEPRAQKKRSRATKESKEKNSPACMRSCSNDPPQPKSSHPTPAPWLAAEGWLVDKEDLCQAARRAAGGWRSATKRKCKEQSRPVNVFALQT